MQEIIAEFNSRSITKAGYSYYLAIAPEWVRANQLEKGNVKIKQLANSDGTLTLKPVKVIQNG